ncbi:carbohydrate ABC transporter permease [Oceanicaulis sp.]|uniref:carbohydrate ABC transporter permease n=1 Tax=Oceanicaulis sp. TaxID=1924941 RepID=UPI003F70A16C
MAWAGKKQASTNRITAMIVVAAAILMIVPLAWVLLLSLKDNSELMTSTATAFNGRYTLDNYLNILADGQVLRWVLNSLIVSVFVTTGVLALSSLAGYGFARLEFPGKNILFVIVLLGLAVPEQAVIIARHQIFSWLSIHNTYPALIIPGLAAPFGVFLMTQYFRAIPKAIDEAALLDGASRFTVFRKVLLPLTIPAQATLGIFTFLTAWNDYWWPLVSATKGSMFTLTVGIASQQQNFAQTEGLGFLMAQAVFAALPVLLVYIYFQKYIIQAVAGAAVK